MKCQRVAVFDGESDFMKDVSSLIKTRLTADHIAFLNSVAEVAAHNQVSVYVVGGFVRDLLLNIKNVDIDLVVAGDGIVFAEKLAEKFDGRTSRYKKFGTATLILQGRPNIDVATARTESYSCPAALPDVEPSTIKQDLARRDFTVNSMAVKLSERGTFFLIDLFGGEIDLKNGLIRVLHDRSFVDDPCRLFRAIRFEQRFEFCMKGQTKQLMRNAIESNLIDQLSGDRLMNEIKILLSEADPVRCVDRMRELSLLQTIAPEIFDDDIHWTIMKKVDSALAWADMISMTKKPEAWFVYFHTLFMVTDDEAFKGMMMRLNFPSNIYGRMCSDRECFVEAMHDLSEERELKPSEIYNIFSKQSSEAVILLLAACSNKRMKEYVELYFKKYCASAKIELNGDDLIGMGMEPGASFNDVFKALRDARINGQVTSRDEEIVLVESQFLK